MSLTSPCRRRTRVAGAFLFLPLLVKLRFDQIVAKAGYPGSEMIPALSALLALLTLKLLDKERRSHINDFNFDEALGLFAGLNILPKKSYATDYSYLTTRENQRALLEEWVHALGPVMFPEANTFSLDFHPIPYRGDPTGLDQHYLPRRGVAGPSVQTFFALEQETRCLCDANANLTRADRNGELMRFVEFWHTIMGSDPQWLYFDSKLIDYPELSRVNQRGIHFITIRRRGTAILRRLQKLPRSRWTGAVLDTPQRCHQRIQYVDETVTLRGYEGPVRQIAVEGLGHQKPTLFLSNHLEETPRNLIIRYAGRNRVEDGLGTSVNFFHLDCLASEVRLNVDLDAAMTVLANGCYRWLGKQLRGYEKAAPKQLYRCFVETGGVVKTTDDTIIVRFDKRSHNPILREAGLDREAMPIPWLGGRRLRLAFR
ncbi:MAG: hypothetical protein ACXVA6_20765 [Isosphaeraceae bacterium]